MKQTLIDLLNTSLTTLQEQGVLSDIPSRILLTHSKNKTHGDYASNIAMVLSKQATPPQSPKDLAQRIVEGLPQSNEVLKVEVAGTGFINFFASKHSQNQVITEVLTRLNNFGHSQYGTNQAILVEFVSANPTGPLHVGHGRGAAYGSSIANLLKAVGFMVDCEYYVNDAGRQMDILAVSVYLRYLQQLGIDIPFANSGYQGDYIINIAKDILAGYQQKFRQSAEKILKDVKDDEEKGGDKEQYIDNLIANIKQLLGEDYHLIFDFSIQTIIKEIKTDLTGFRVQFDDWFSEQSLMSSQRVQKALSTLKKQQVVYEKSKALWFRSTDFGDEKDRVVVRENGQSTYFASDIAYHQEKLERQLLSVNKKPKQYDKIINIWGADHHGYIARVKAGIQALGLDSGKLEILLVQFANLYRGKVKVPMSTRSGSFVSLRELREEIGNDATRFFYVLRKAEQHMDFDLELAKSKTNENPVYYIQYAYARIHQVLAKSSMSINDFIKADLSLLTHKYEQALIKKLSRYTDTLHSAAIQREPHQMAYYLRELAQDLHSYYANIRFLEGDLSLITARLALISAVAQVIKNALNLLGVDAPKSM